MLDRLDKNDSKNASKKNKRSSARIAYRKNDVAVRIYHPGGSASACMVSTRDLSTGGISFLYDGFLHKDTRVEIVLRRRAGGDDVIRGVVQHCALVHKNVHLVGIRFENTIFPKLYIDPSEWGEIEDGTSGNSAELQGTVLHLDDQETDRLLMSHFTKGTKITLISTGTIEEALVQLKAHKITCILCDLILSNSTTGEQAIAQFREQGFTGPIGVVTSETSTERLKNLENLGANAILGKPLDSGKLRALLGPWLSGRSGVGEAIVSTLSEAMRPMVEQYIGKLRMLGVDLRRLMEEQNVGGLRNVCYVIKSTSSGFGFQRLSELANVAVTSLDASPDLKNSLAHVQAVEGACGRARAA